MFELHGWITIHESECDSISRCTRARIWELIEPAQQGSAMVDLRGINGELMIHMGGYFNRRSPDVDELISLFQKSSEIAEDSYGLLYYRDSEESDSGGHNSFHVLIMRHGQVTNERDTLLSPVIPTIEYPEQ